MSAPFLGNWSALSGIIPDYEECWIQTTDAPRVYHVACAFAVLSTIVERKVYLPFGGERLYPNLFALLLGPSSFYRKSTTIAKAKKTIAKLFHDDTHGPLLPDEFSREALLKRLSERAQGLLSYSEFSGALAVFSRDYMLGTKELLADLYDCPDKYTRVVGAQTFTLHDVHLTILAASQTDWFLEKLKAGDVRGGFLARFSFWPAFEKPNFLAVPDEPDRAVAARLVSALNRVRQVSGPAVLEKVQQKRYSAWVEQHERELNGASHVGELSPFWSRLSITTLKFAILIQLAHDQTLTISPAALESAIELTDFLKASLRYLFAEEFAFTEPMRNRQKILRLVRARPGIERRDLMRAASLLVRDFEQVVSTLSAEERIERRGKQFFALETSVSQPAVSESRTDRVEPMFTPVK
jgi:hypothetical protein